MRLLVLIALLGNVAFYAWAHYQPESSSPEAQLMAQQLNPEAIRLLSPPQVAARKPDTAAEQARASVCMEWNGLGQEDIARAQSALQPVAQGLKVTERKLEETTGWWVFMPPQASRPAAVQKVEEIKRLGIDEYFIVQEDPKFRFAISLGIFRTEEAAKNKLEQLQAKGVRTARVGPRTTPVGRVVLRINDIPEEATAALTELAKDFPGSAIRVCGT